MRHLDRQLPRTVPAPKVIHNSCQQHVQQPAPEFPATRRWIATPRRHVRNRLSAKRTLPRHSSDRPPTKWAFSVAGKICGHTYLADHCRFPGRRLSPAGFLCQLHARIYSHFTRRRSYTWLEFQPRISKTSFLSNILFPHSRMCLRIRRQHPHTLRIRQVNHLNPVLPQPLNPALKVL